MHTSRKCEATSWVLSWHLQALAQYEGNGPVLWHWHFNSGCIKPLHHLLANAPTTVASPFTCVSKVVVIRCHVHAPVTTSFRLKCLIDENLKPDVIAQLPTTIVPEVMSTPHHFFSNLLVGHDILRLCSTVISDWGFLSVLAGTIDFAASDHSTEASFYVV